MRYTFVLFILILTISNGRAQSVKIEAEDGILTGDLSVYTAISGFSGEGYVGNFTSDFDTLTVRVSIESAHAYQLAVIFNTPSDEKTQNLLVNGAVMGQITTPPNSGFDTLDVGGIWLDEGENAISIAKSWGWVNIDAFLLTPRPINIYEPTKQLIDPDAGGFTKALYARLLAGYGTHILSGMHDTRKDLNGDYINLDNLKDEGLPQPAIFSSDLSSYTTLNPWLWDSESGDHTFGYVGDQSRTIEGILDWYALHEGRGIIELTWHWHAPIAEEAGVNNFYTENVDFDVRQAITTGTDEYNAVLEDIDSIAVQLKRLEDTGIAVLWRPLHEAGGAWFWWGAHGPEPTLTLWDLLYDRLTTHHDIHNLIWIWSTPEADWYPGNDKVDIIGYDSYPGEYNYGSQKSMFDRLYDMTHGEKMIAMTENGPIPDIDALFEQDTPWAWWSTWAELTFSHNSMEHIAESYGHSKVLTADSPIAIGTVSNSSVVEISSESEGSVNESSVSENLSNTSSELIQSQSSVSKEQLSSDQQSTAMIETIFDASMYGELNGEMTIYSVHGTRVRNISISAGTYLNLDELELPQGVWFFRSNDGVEKKAKIFIIH